jgi:hypothetical protein
MRLSPLAALRRDREQIPFFLFLLFGPLLECISRDEVYYHNSIISIQLLDLQLTRNLTLTSQK